MIRIKALFRLNKNAIRDGKYYVSRIYTLGWEDNLAAWEEEVRERFPDIIQHFGDDPNDCHLRGEAKCVWMTFHKHPKITVDDPTDNYAYQKVTMFRVHRNNTPGSKVQ